MSNGKKLGVKSKVSDNYLVTGNDYEKFQEALHDMDNRTVIIPVRNPESMRIHCVIAKSDKEHASPRFVVLDPMEMKDSILLSDESIFSAEKCNIGRYKPTSEVFLSLQNQIKEIEQIGFFLTVHDQKKIIVTPSKKFLTALCQRLETGTLAKGTNIFAYCYLASRCVQAKEFIIIGRKEEKDSSWVKGFHAASTKYAYIPQHFILRELQNFQENHDVTTLGWELSNYYTTIETSVYKGYKQDKIEMRGDRAEMSDFPLYLNTVAGGLDRRDQTIGGFSFVVKIYAVPVVEIIG